MNPLKLHVRVQHVWKVESNEDLPTSVLCSRDTLDELEDDADGIENIALRIEIMPGAELPNEKQLFEVTITPITESIG